MTDRPRGTVHLTEAECEGLCICAEAGSDQRTETEVIGLCNAHLARVERVIAARQEAALRQAGQDFLAQYSGFGNVRPVDVRRWLLRRAEVL